MHKEHFCTTETPQKITENHGKSRKITENHGKSRKGFFMPIAEIVEALVAGGRGGEGLSVRVGGCIQPNFYKFMKICALGGGAKGEGGGRFERFSRSQEITSKRGC